ncbi:MAG: SRPBCC domain-containing protein [Pseudomonadales bacterium]
MNNTGIPQDRLGSVGQLDDGRYFVLFERQTRHSLDTVWQALTQPQQLAVWFPEIKLQARTGGAFHIWFGDGCDGPADVEGIVTTFDPPHVLQFGSMRFELEENAHGCVIRFSDVLDFQRGRTPLSVTDSVLAGWHRFMDALQAHLDDVVFDRDAPEPDYRGVKVPGKERVPGKEAVPR